MKASNVTKAHNKRMQTDLTKRYALDSAADARRYVAYL
jgi:hypothetical protein